MTTGREVSTAVISAAIDIKKLEIAILEDLFNDHFGLASSPLSAQEVWAAIVEKGFLVNKLQEILNLRGVKK